MKLPDLNTKGLRAWAVVNARTGQLRMRAAGTSFDDWQAKIFSSKKIARKYAWQDEAIIPVEIVERPGKKEMGS